MDKDVVHTHTGILLSHKKRMKKCHMGKHRDYHVKGSQKEKDKHHMISLMYGIYNMTQMNLST